MRVLKPERDHDVAGQQDVVLVLHEGRQVEVERLGHRVDEHLQLHRGRHVRVAQAQRYGGRQVPARAVSCGERGEE